MIIRETDDDYSKEKEYTLLIIFVTGFFIFILVQLHFPVQLPCFSFTTIMNLYLGVSM